MTIQDVSKKFLVRLLIKKRSPKTIEVEAIDKRDCIARVQKEYRTISFRILDIKEK